MSVATMGAVLPLFLLGAPDPVPAEVLAEVLAALLKANVAEAFVIPTGGMAPTLMGGHADVACANCGWRYAANMSHRLAPAALPDDEHLPTACANCGARNDLPANASMRKGDRILAEKLVPPNRWELVVFKYPEDPRSNFVQRLVGLPGETVEIAAGDLFVNGSRLRKAPETIPEMWLPVHDTAFPPRTPVPGGPGWSPAGKATHWQPTPKGWRFSGSGAPEEALVYRGAIRDWLAYNARSPQVRAMIVGKDAEAAPPPVGDVRIECSIEQFSGKGPIGFRWEYAGHRVTATVAAAGRVRLVAEAVASSGSPGGKPAVAEGSLAGALRPDTRLAFVHRDGQAYLAENRAVVVAIAVGPEDLPAVRRRFAPPPEPCRLAVLAADASVSLSRIVLSRDVHYRTMEEMGLPGTLQPSRPADRIVLGADEHFMLGDNSAQSKDSRFWGAVRSAAIVGVVRAIYWPPERYQVFPWARDRARGLGTGSDVKR